MVVYVVFLMMYVDILCCMALCGDARRRLMIYVDCTMMDDDGMGRMMFKDV